MLPFFRKIRWRLARDNQLFKYSRYAIGEIVLVVIGILIALQINNWNEEKKEREKFDQIMVEVEQELLGNISACRWVLNNYLFRQDSIANLILFNELTVDDYMDNPSIGYLVSSNLVSIIETDAFNKLLDINGLFSTTQDSLRKVLRNLYNLKIEIEDDGNRTHALVQQQAKDNKEFPWYNDWLANIPNEERIEYLANNPKYRKDVGEYTSEQMRWLRPDIENFEIIGRQVYNRIYHYLESNLIKHDDSLYFQYDAQDYKHYVGVYVETERSSPNMVVTDSTVISIENQKLYYTPFVKGQGSKREIIPVSQNKFRTEFARGFYRLIFDDNGKVIEHHWSDGLGNRKSVRIR